MDKQMRIRLTILVILNIISFIGGLYLFFIVYKPIIAQIFNTNKNDLLFNIYYIIYFSLWAVTMFCTVSTSIRLNPNSVYEGKLTSYHKLTLLGFFLEIGVLILTPKKSSPIISLGSLLVFLLIITLPYIIFFLSHYKSFVLAWNVLMKDENLEDELNKLTKDKDFDKEEGLGRIKEAKDYLNAKRNES